MKLNKLFILILSIIFLSASISAETFKVNQIYNPLNFDNPSNTYDNDKNTYSEYNITTSSSNQYYEAPALIFNNEYINQIEIKASARSSSTGVDRYIYLQKLNGGVWTDVSNSGLIDNVLEGTWETTITINDTIDSLRFRFFHGTVGSSDFSYKSYLINYTNVNSIYSNESPQSILFNVTNNTNSKLFYSLFSGNVTSYDTRNDGTLNGYTFNDGTNNGMTIDNNSFSFDGSNDYINVPDDNVLDFSSTFSISSWVYFDTTGTFKIISGKGSGGSCSGYNYLLDFDNLQRIQFCGGSGGAYKRAITTATYSPNTWYHVTAVYTSVSDIKIYVDGVSQAVTLDGSALQFNTNANALTIGQANSLNWYSGNMGTYSMYNKALNSSEITEIYNAGRNAYTPIGSGLVAQYNAFGYEDATQPTTIYDTNHIVSTGIYNELTQIDNINYDHKGMTFDGTGDEVNIGNSITTTTNGTIALWVKYDSSQVNSFPRLISQGNSNSFDLAVRDSNNRLFIQLGGFVHLDSYTNSVDDNQWTFVTVTYNSDKVIQYKNGVLVQNVSTIIPSTTNTNDIFLGAYTTGSQNLKGSMDEVKVYTRVLTPNEVLNLYYAGLGNNTEQVNTSGQVAYYSFEEMQNTKIHDRNAQICIECKNKTLDFTLNAGIFSLWAFDETNNFNTNSYLYVDFTAPTISDNLSFEYNNGYSIDLSGYVSATDTLSGVSSCIVNFTTSNQSTTCSDTNFTFNQNGNISYNVIATDNSGNSASSSGTIYINPTQYWYFEDSLSSPITNFTINGTNYTDYYSINLFDLGYGNHSITFEKIGYETQTISFVFNTTSAINTTITANNARILLYIRDKQTTNLITGTNFTVEFISSVGLETSTTTGLVNVTNTFFQNEEYTVVITNANYETETLVFDFTNQESITLNAYMIESNNTNLGVVFVKPVNRFSKPVIGAIVKALQWNTATSTFIEVSQGVSGTDGLGRLNIILNDKLYLFTATSGGFTGQTETEEIIDTTENGKTITIIIPDESSEQNYLSEYLTTIITESFDENTNISTINFYWNDLTGISQTVCISAHRTLGNTNSLLSRNCTSGVSGEYILNFFINSSFKTTLKAEVKVGDSYYTLKSFVHYPENNVAEVLSDLGFSVLIVPFLMIFAIGIAMTIENVYIGTFLIVIFSGLSLILAPTILTSGIVAFLGFIGWLTINYGVKRQ